MSRGVAPAIGLLIGIRSGNGAGPDQYRPGQVAGADLRQRLRGLPQVGTGAGQRAGQSPASPASCVEHYTASKDQAAALAAYVMGAGGGEAAPARTGPEARAAAPDATELPLSRAAKRGRPGKPDQAPPAAGRPRTATGDRQPEPPRSSRRPLRPRNSPRPSLPSRPRPSPPQRNSPAAVQGRARPRRRAPMPAKTRRSRATIFPTEERLA